MRRLDLPLAENIDPEDQAELESLRKQIADGMDINAQDELGRTALHRAAINNNYLVARFCLENDADFTIYDNDNYTALGLAARSGGIDFILEMREFYRQQEETAEFLDLLEQPQGFWTVFGFRIPFTASSFEDLVEEFYPAEDEINKRFLLNLRLETAALGAAAVAGDPFVRAMLGMEEEEGHEEDRVSEPGDSDSERSDESRSTASDASSETDSEPPLTPRVAVAQALQEQQKKDRVDGR